jgi:hypothetical protein
MSAIEFPARTGLSRDRICGTPSPSLTSAGCRRPAARGATTGTVWRPSGRAGNPVGELLALSGGGLGIAEGLYRDDSVGLGPRGVLRTANTSNRCAADHLG